MHRMPFPEVHFTNEGLSTMDDGQNPRSSSNEGRPPTITTVHVQTQSKKEHLHSEKEQTNPVKESKHEAFVFLIGNELKFVGISAHRINNRQRANE